MLSRLDLPQPEGPMMPSDSPRSTLKLMRSMARTSRSALPWLYTLLSWSMTMGVVMSAIPPAAAHTGAHARAHAHAGDGALSLALARGGRRRGRAGEHLLALVQAREHHHLRAVRAAQFNRALLAAG